MWAKRTIQKKVEHKAHMFKIRVNRVNAKNTSALAFDGSGKVKRDVTNYSKCIFATGKQYNSDLNASYNIGARYFIREIQKTISEKKWSQVLAKVPGLERRTQCTLSSLISLVAVL
jgi:transposase